MSYARNTMDPNPGRDKGGRARLPGLAFWCRTGFASIVLGVLTVAAGGAETDQWPGRLSKWQGFSRYDFSVDGRACFVVTPAEQAPGNPWVWRARFPNYHAEADAILLRRGMHVAYINTNDMLGSPRAMKHWDAFYNFVTARGLSKTVALEGVSRGGLFVYAWAARHADRVACIYADTPVCDIKSWPLGRGKGIGHAGTWKRLLGEYGLTADQALEYSRNPIDILEPIAKAGIPLLHIVSLTDTVVPPEENTTILAERYRKLGGAIDVVEVAQGTSASHGHHFSHPDPQRVADFIWQHSTGAPEN